MATQTTRQEREAWYSHAGDTMLVTIVSTTVTDEWRVKGEMANRFHGAFGKKFFETEAEALAASREFVAQSLKQAHGTVRHLETRLNRIEERVAQLEAR